MLEGEESERNRGNVREDRGKEEKREGREKVRENTLEQVGIQMHKEW